LSSKSAKHIIKKKNKERHEVSIEPIWLRNNVAKKYHARQVVMSLPCNNAAAAAAAASADADDNLRCRINDENPRPKPP